MPRSPLPEIDAVRCTLCGDCIAVCPTDALGIRNGREILVETRVCVSCTVCEAVCPAGAIAMREQDW